MTISTPSVPPPLCEDPAFFHLLTGSFARLVGRPLVDAGGGAGFLYHHCPVVVVAHDTAADPVFVYANRTAQRCFEYPWDAFVTLPSRLSAELPDRAERQQLLDRVARDGFISNYSGIRIARSGRRFRIENGTVWQLIDEKGGWHGQAATFSSWRDV